MPNQSHSGIHVAPWHRCDRCGMEYPSNQLTRQRGLILCPKDVDNALVWERDAIMEQVLENNQPEMDVAEILKEVPDVDTEPDWGP